MGKVISLHVGDPCPACGGTLAPALQATPEQRAKASNRDDSAWVPIPPHYDTATLEMIADDGPLFRCGGCGYQTRFKLVAA